VGAGAGSAAPTVAAASQMFAALGIADAAAAGGSQAMYGQL
jgi:hypothetical protein